MASEQKEIYCLLAAEPGGGGGEPIFRSVKERKFEVLFLYDAWDEFVIEHLHAFDGKPLKLAEKRISISAQKRKARCPKRLPNRCRNGSRKRSATRSTKCALATPRGKSGCGRGCGQIHDRKHAAHDEGHESRTVPSCPPPSMISNQSRHPIMARLDAMRQRMRARRQRRRTNPRQRPRARPASRRSARDAHAANSLLEKV